MSGFACGQAKQLVDQHVFEKECTGDEEGPAKKLCFLAFLPDILDSKAAGRNAYIKACFHFLLLSPSLHSRRHS